MENILIRYAGSAGLLLNAKPATRKDTSEGEAAKSTRAIDTHTHTRRHTWCTSPTTLVVMAVFLAMAVDTKFRCDTCCTWRLHFFRRMGAVSSGAMFKTKTNYAADPPLRLSSSDTAFGMSHATDLPGMHDRSSIAPRVRSKRLLQSSRRRDAPVWCYYSSGGGGGVSLCCVARGWVLVGVTQVLSPSPTTDHTDQTRMRRAFACPALHPAHGHLRPSLASPQVHALVHS